MADVAKNMVFAKSVKAKMKKVYHSGFSLNIVRCRRYHGQDHSELKGAYLRGRLDFLMR
jgi:hypothetical protein